MTGGWISTIARRLLRDDTFRLMVAPAIADLQVEHNTRRGAALVRDHAVICWLVIRAIGADFRRDAASLVTPDLMRGVWPRLLGLYALVVLIQLATRLDGGIRLHTPDMAPGEFTSLPLPAMGDGLMPYLAGLLVTIAVTGAGYITVPAVFMLRRRQVNTRAIVLGIIAFSIVSYGSMRLARPVVQQSSDYATAAIIRGTGWYPANEPLAAIIREEIQPRRTASEARALATLAQGGRDPEKARLAQRRWTEISRGLSVMVYALVGAAIARGSGIGVLIRLAGIVVASGALALLLPYLNLLIWPIYPATLAPFDRPQLESQLAFAVLPIASAIVLLLPRRRTKWAA